GYLDPVHLSRITRERLLSLPWEQDLDEAMLERLLTEHLATLPDQQRKWIEDALAVAAYHAQTDWPVIRLLVGDDAPQWTWLTEILLLFWGQEGRHTKKLPPWAPAHRPPWAAFLTQFWDFYGEL